MLDDRTRMMLEVANTLTEEDLEFIRSGGVVRITRSKAAPRERAPAVAPPVASSAPVPQVVPPEPLMAVVGPPPAMAAAPAATAGSRGDYERRRTRESKTSTACVGGERVRHDWWPMGTELVGEMGAEVFTAVVVENPSVKSGRSIRITSGPAQGRTCNTPTRAALEATEGYRQAHQLGRAGGVTNGWLFWRPRTGATRSAHFAVEARQTIGGQR